MGKNLLAKVLLSLTLSIFAITNISGQETNNNTLLPALQNDKEIIKLSKEVELLRLQNQKKELELKLEEKLIDLEERRREAKIDKIQFESELREVLEKSKRKLSKEPYRIKPYQRGTIYLSDRKIDMPIVVTTDSADYVVNRISYYNRKNRKYPIFLVIKTCYGGSVTAGERILKAMKSSKSPIYVVVKTYAASMCAIITTLAERSYIYPNAEMLHHQISWGTRGNTSQMAYDVNLMYEWERRVLSKVAKKMGISLEKFVDEMYKNNPNGDWMQFGDKAIKSKWVNKLVHNIVDESVREEVNYNDYVGMGWSYYKKINGKVHYVLPPLLPNDKYYMINPNAFFKVSIGE